MFNERVSFSVNEAAELIGVSRVTVYNQIAAGNLGSIKVGRRRLITRDQIEAFLRERTDDA